MTLREAAREWLPPVAHRFIAELTRQRLTFSAAPDGWAAAVARSSGYDHSQILERVAAATREVVAGRAAYERDSVLFHEPGLRFEILAPLLRAALRHGGRVEVIDFGGSLGSSYRQCRPFIPLGNVSWHVVEQAAFAAAGTAEFTTPELSFHSSIDDLPAAALPRTLLASSVLQYLEDPLAHLRQWATLDIDTLIIDRTPMSGVAESALCIQHVPRHIYPASYPCWVLSRERLLATLGSGWQLLAEFGSLEGKFRARGGPRFAFSGMILERQL